MWGKTIVACAVLALVAAFSIPMSVAMDHHDDHDMHADKMKQKWDGMSDAKKAKLMAKAEDRKMFARMNFTSDGYASGKFVSFHYAADIGAIHDFTVKDGNASNEFFDEVKPGNWTAKKDPFVTGSVLHAPGQYMGILIHNNPTGLIQWKARANGTTLSFDLGPNATAGAAGKNVRINVTGGAHGHLMTNGAANVTNSSGTFTVTLNKGEMAMFRAHPTNAKGDGEGLHDENDAFVKGKLGATVRVAESDGDVLEDTTEDGATAETTEMVKGRVKIIFGSATVKAKVVFVTVDGETVNPANASSVTVKIDGQDVVRVDSVGAVVNADIPLAFVKGVTADGTVYVAVNIDHFSDREVTIEDTSAGPTTSPAPDDDETTRTPGLGLAGVLAAFALTGVVLARRRE